MRLFLFSSLFSIVLVVSGCSSVSERPVPDAVFGTVDAAWGADAAVPVDAAAPPDAALLADAAVAPDAPLAPDAGPPPSFDTIYESILVPRCGRCHVDEVGATYTYRPRLTDVDTAYAALFDVPAETSWVRYCVPDGVVAYRVRAFDPGASMLAFLPTCYVRDADHGDLTPEELERIRAWIAAGAPREPF